MTVYLTYFKETGKFNTTGVYNTHHREIDRIWGEIRDMKANGRLPGLTPGANPAMIAVDVPDCPHNHPRIIL